MVRVTLSPEALTSFRRLPAGVRVSFDQVLLRFIEAERLRLPRNWPVNQLEGSRNLWTLKLGRHRGIFR
jgi:hypothetical protein